jgi:hypothetical protein
LTVLFATKTSFFVLESRVAGSLMGLFAIVTGVKTIESGVKAVLRIINKAKSEGSGLSTTVKDAMTTVKGLGSTVKRAKNMLGMTNIIVKESKNMLHVVNCSGAGPAPEVNGANRIISEAKKFFCGSSTPLSVKEKRLSKRQTWLCSSINNLDRGHSRYLTQGE